MTAAFPSNLAHWKKLSQNFASQKVASAVVLSDSSTCLYKMSMFGGGFQAQQAVNPQNIAMAEQELDMVTDLFNR